MDAPSSVIARLHGLPLHGSVRVPWPPPPYLEFPVKTVNVGPNGEAGLLAIRYTRSVHWRSEGRLNYYMDDVARILPPGTSLKSLADLAMVWGPRYVCVDCAGEGHGEPPQYNRDRGAVHDLQYQGGKFHAGEW